MIVLRVIFDQWPKLHLGLDVRPEIPILKGLYLIFIHTIIHRSFKIIIGSGPMIILGSGQKKRCQPIVGLLCSLMNLNYSPKEMK